MSLSVRIVRFCDIDTHARDQDVLVFRDIANNISSVALNEQTLSAFCEASSVRVIYVRKHALQFHREEEQKGVYFLLAQVEPSGLVHRFFDRSLHELRMMPLDANWPRVVTVHTYEGSVVGIDDMPILGLQPVIVRRVARGNTPDTPEFEHVLRHASERQVLIVLNPDDANTVEQVLVPHYDYQIPAAQRRFKHQSVPFVQRWPLVRLADNSLADWRTWVGRDRAPRTAAPTRRFICVTDEKQVPFYDWSVPPSDVFFCLGNTDGSGPVRVWQWRERMCQADVAQREFLPTLVFDPTRRRLDFVGFNRTYPLANGGTDTCTWFFADLLQTGANAASNADIHDAATNSPSGTSTALMTAHHTDAVLDSLLPLDKLVNSVYSSRSS